MSKARTVGNLVATGGPLASGGITSGVVTGALGFTPESSSNKNTSSGYAGLDGTGKVASAQLPSYVDDVLEYANQASLPVTGETSKIYITLDTNRAYRWSGSIYVEIATSSGGSAYSWFFN